MANERSECKPRVTPPLNGPQNGNGALGTDPDHDTLPNGGPIDSDTMAELKACLEMPEDLQETPDVESRAEIGGYDAVYQAVVDDPALWEKVISGRSRLAITRMAWIGYASNDWSRVHWLTILFLAWRDPETRLWIEGAMQDAFWTKKRREAWAVLAEKEEVAETKANRAAGGLTIISTLEVKPRAVRWLWPGLIALGRVSILVGLPNTRTRS